MLTMKDIVFDTDPIVREKSLPVELPLSKEDEQLLLDMHEFVLNSQDEELSEKYGIRSVTIRSMIHRLRKNVKTILEKLSAQ